MAVTASGIWYPGPTDPITPIENVFSTMAQSVETVLGVRLFATTAARDAAYASVPFKMCVVGANYDAGIWYVHQAGAWQVIDAIAGVNTLMPNPVPTTSFAGAYPTGLSMFALTLTQATSDGGYPENRTATVYTIVTSAGLAVQYFVGLATGNPSMWMRTLGTSANSTWKLIVSGADVMPTTYTPNLTAATTNPTGQTTTGRYSVTAGVCSFTFSATIGTGTGSGAYSISVPVPVGANWLAGYGGSGAIAGIGNGSLQQGSNRVQGQWGILSGSLRLYVPTAFNTVSAVTSVLPFALASGSVMYGEVQFGTT